MSMLFNPYNNQMNTLQNNMMPQNPVYPYYTPQTQTQNTNNKLPPQQVLQANGKSSIDALQMSPNSSVLIMDSTAPIIWMCISDGLGNVSSTPYDIAPHVDKVPIDMNVLDQRLSVLEDTLRRMEDINHAKSYDTRSNAKQNGSDNGSNKRYDERHA